MRHCIFFTNLSLRVFSVSEGQKELNTPFKSNLFARAVGSDTSVSASVRTQPIFYCDTASNVMPLDAHECFARISFLNPRCTHNRGFFNAYLTMVISASLHDLMCTVYLLYEDEEGEGVWHDEVGDTESLVWYLCEELEIDAIASTDDEYYIFRVIF